MTACGICVQSGVMSCAAHCADHRKNELYMLRPANKAQIYNTFAEHAAGRCITLQEHERFGNIPATSTRWPAHSLPRCTLFATHASCADVWQQRIWLHALQPTAPDSYLVRSSAVVLGSVAPCLRPTAPSRYTLHTKACTADVPLRIRQDQAGYLFLANRKRRYKLHHAAANLLESCCCYLCSNPVVEYLAGSRCCFVMLLSNSIPDLVLFLCTRAPIQF